MDHIVIKNTDTAELRYAIEQGSRDIGLDPGAQVVPWWAKNLIIDLFKVGWRRSPDGSFDHRDRKELYQEQMVLDMVGNKAKQQPLTWMLQLATRLVEAGWEKTGRKN